jgi:hypothetical protein
LDLSHINKTPQVQSPEILDGWLRSEMETGLPPRSEAIKRKHTEMLEHAVKAAEFPPQLEDGASAGVTSTAAPANAMATTGSQRAA